MTISVIGVILFCKMVITLSLYLSNTLHNGNDSGKRMGKKNELALAFRDYSDFPQLKSV